MFRWWRRFFRSLLWCDASKVLTEGDLEDKPTQRDKPSPSSHFPRDELLRKKKRQWPRRDGYWITLVANTNSMEPVIDDNSVVVCEDLRTVKGKEFLEEWPLQIGDVCVYVGDQKLWGGRPWIIHQIYQIKTDAYGDKSYKFRGVNNFGVDPGWVWEENIILRAFEFCSARHLREGD